MRQVPYSATPSLTVVLMPNGESPLSPWLLETVASLCHRHAVQVVLFRDDLPAATDGLEELPGLTVLSPPNEASSFREWRGLALAAASGDIVLFARGNDEAVEDRLRRLIEVYGLPVRTTSEEDMSPTSAQLPLSGLAKAPPQ